MTTDDLERRAIIAAHDAECHCGDVPSTSLLTERERHIVALWRADRERLTDVIEQINELVGGTDIEDLEQYGAIVDIRRTLRTLDRTEATDGTR